MPLVVVVTDGLPTIAVRTGAEPVADLLAEGRALRRARIGCVVAEVEGPEPGCAEALAAGEPAARTSRSHALAAELVLGVVEDAA